jgi:HK97 family phage prohead protease
MSFDDRERRTLAWKVPAIELRTAADGSRHIVGYASVFNRYSQDLGGWVEQVAPGAFTKTIAEADIYGLFNHNVDLVLGRNRAETMSLAEDVTGLAYDIALNSDDSDAANVAAKVGRGDITGSSFSFRALDVEWGLTDQEMPLRTLKAVRLYDVGPVTFPAYLATQEAGAAVALRSLAVQCGRPVDELVAAADRRELRSYIHADGEGPGQPPTPDLDSHRRRLELMRRHSSGAA